MKDVASVDATRLNCTLSSYLSTCNLHLTATENLPCEAFWAFLTEEESLRFEACPQLSFQFYFFSSTSTDNA